MASKPKSQTPEEPTVPPMTAADIYRTHLTKYPDVLTVLQVSEILGISTKTVYTLINKGNLRYLQVGREKRIPKLYWLQYLKLLDCNAITN